MDHGFHSYVIYVEWLEGATGFGFQQRLPRQMMKTTPSAEEIWAWLGAMTMGYPLANIQKAIENGYL